MICNTAGAVHRRFDCPLLAIKPNGSVYGLTQIEDYSHQTIGIPTTVLDGDLLTNRDPVKSMECCYGNSRRVDEHCAVWLSRRQRICKTKVSINQSIGTIMKDLNKQNLTVAAFAVAVIWSNERFHPAGDLANRIQ